MGLDVFECSSDVSLTDVAYIYLTQIINMGFPFFDQSAVRVKDIKLGK